MLVVRTSSLTLPAWSRLSGPIMAGLAALALGACSTIGLDAPRVPFIGGGGRPTAPVVTDPAPYVSGTLRPYQIRGRWYYPAEDTRYDEVGLASWYGQQFHGRPTATGERFDMNALTAAHKTLALPALVEVTNLENGRSLVLRVNDRGPFVDGRIIDLSRGAAQELGLLNAGVGRVRVRYVGRAPRLDAGPVRHASTPSATPAPATRGGGPIWVQAGSFSDRDNARRAAQRLGDRARVDRVRIGGRRMFRVMVGPWSDANQAEQARLNVIAHGFGDAVLFSGGR